LKNFYKSIYQEAPLGVQIFDKEGNSFAYNTKQKEYLGLTDSKTGIGQFNVLTDPYSLKTGANLLYQKAYRGEKTEHEFEYQLGIKENKWETRKDNRIFHETIVPI